MPDKRFKTNLDKTLEAGKRIQKDFAWANYWIPKVGENEIRVLPPWSKEGLPFKELVVHFSVGPDKRTLSCLKRFGKPCYVCEMINELKKAEDMESQDMARRMSRNSRYLWNIVDLHDLKSGVQVYSCGIRVFEGIWAYFADEDWGDITSPEKGYNLTVTRLGSGINTKYQVRARRKQSTCPKLLDGSDPVGNLFDLDTVTPVVTYIEQKQIFEGLVEGELEEAAEEEAEEKELEKEEAEVEKHDIDKAELDEKAEPEKEKEKATSIGTLLTKPGMRPCFGKDFDASNDECAKCSDVGDCVRVQMSRKKKAKEGSDAEKIEEELRRG